MTHNEKLVRIVITHGLPDDNPGGCAIAMGMIKALRTAFPNCHLSLVSYYSNKKRLSLIHRHLLKKFPDVELLKTPIAHRNEVLGSSLPGSRYIRFILWLSTIVWATVKLFSPRFVFTNETVNRLKQADVILSRGTQIFYDKTRFPVRKALSLYWISYPILLAKKLKKPYIIYGQSFGPLHKRISQWIVKQALKRTTLILTREQRSMDFLITQGIPKDKIRVIPDAAFALQPPRPEAIKKMCARFKVSLHNFLAVTVTSWEDTCVSSIFIKNMACVVDEALNRSYIKSCVIVNQVRKGPALGEDDTTMSNMLLKQIINKNKCKLIDEDLSPLELLSLYGGAKVMMGTRLHSVILALISGTPSIAVSYAGPKTQGIMEMLGLSYYVLDMKSFDLNKALCLIQELCNSNNIKRNEISDRLTIMRKKAFLTTDILKSFIQRNT